MKITGFIALLIVLFVSLFKLAGADLTNNVTAVALMVLLLALFTDLKEFNFWGLKGVAKEEKKLRELKGEEAIKSTKTPKVTADQIQTVVRHDTVVVMDSERGNFLALAFEIERLMRIAAAIILGSEVPSSMSAARVVEILKDEGVLTEAGEQQVESIRWLRNMFVHGRQHELAAQTLKDGLDIVDNFYKELKSWIEDAQSKTKKEIKSRKISDR